MIVFPPLFSDHGLMYHLHGPSLQAMDSCRAPTQSFPFHWRGGLVQVLVRTLTPLPPQVTLQEENGVHLEKPPSTAVKKDRDQKCVTKNHDPIKPGRPYTGANEGFCDRGSLEIYSIHWQYRRDSTRQDCERRTLLGSFG